MNWIAPLLKNPLTYCAAGMFLAWISENIRGSFWWGFTVLSALICIYGWLAGGKPGPERYEIADNCYFIGFVYTLAVIALSVGLDAQEIIGAPAGDAGGGSSGGPQRLLETVGIALSTSVTGMLVRFSLTSHKDVKHPEDKFERLIHKASMSVENLTATIEETGKSVNDANKYFAEAGESLHVAARSAENYADKMRSESDNIGKHLTEVAGKLFDDFGNRIADTLQKTQFDNVREDLRDAVEQHRAAAEEISALMKQSAETLQEAARTANAAAESARNSLRQSADADEWEKITQVFAGFSSQVESIGGGLRAVAARQAELAENAEQDIARLRESRDTFHSLLENLREDAAAAAKIKEEYRAEFGKAAKTALAETHQLYAKLIAGAEIALEKNGELQKLADGVQKIAAQMEKNKP